MFGFGGFTADQKKAFNVAVQVVEKQLRDALSDSGRKILNNQQELFFFVGYLDGLVWDLLMQLNDGSSYDISDEMRSRRAKFVLKKVNPELIKFYERAHAARVISSDLDKPEISEADSAYETGHKMGIHDALSVIKWNDQAIQLYNYLLGKELASYDE